jgi:hypothetical protein
MPVDKEKVLVEAEKLLRTAGYTVSRGIFGNFTFQETSPSCGGGSCDEGCRSGCTSGCASGCATCSPGNSNPQHISRDRTLVIPGESILNDIATIIKAPIPIEEKKTKR